MEENSSVETNKNQLIMFRKDRYARSLVMPCCVFWDIEDFPFPAGLSPDSIYKKMKSCLEKMGYTGELTFKAYVDRQRFSVPLGREFWDVGINLFQIRRPGVESSITCRIMFEIAECFVDVRKTCKTPNFFVISNTMEEEEVLLKYLKSYTMYSSHVHTLRDLRAQGNFGWLFQTPIDQSATLQREEQSEETVACES